MKRVVLERRELDFRSTFGILTAGKVKFHTLELGWRLNAKDVSCIPEGIYPVVWEFSARFGRELFELKGVSGRSEIKIHPANLPSELNGCIALGRMKGQINGERGILQSRQAVTHFEQIMGTDPFEIEIVRCTISASRGNSWDSP